MAYLRITKLWGSAEIKIAVSAQGMGAEIPLDDFVDRLCGEKTAGAIAQNIADRAGNPSLLFTKAGLVKRLDGALDREAMKAAFREAAAEVVAAMKTELRKTP